MGLFPEREKMMRYMKAGLPLIFAVAWTPVIWMLLAAVFGPPMQRLFSSWQPVVAILATATVLVMVGLVRLFRSIGLRNSDNAE
ncbi:MAG: hypothetical protein HGB22_06155 [Chlorobiaceae bacterium]|nr:hypothetical protein [Chlorobiaceae bacterium]